MNNDLYKLEIYDYGYIVFKDYIVTFGGRDKIGFIHDIYVLDISQDGVG